MLADDPEHRPSPALLANPAAARARRIAARPPRRAQRPIEVGGELAWTARMLAHACTARRDVAGPMLRNGTIDRWLRRGVGDVDAGSGDRRSHPIRDAEVLAADGRADALLITRAIAVLDPTAPLVWRRMALWPDGLGQCVGPRAAYGAGADRRPGRDRDGADRDGLGRAAGRRARRRDRPAGGSGNPPLVLRRANRRRAHGGCATNSIPLSPASRRPPPVPGRPGCPICCQPWRPMPPDRRGATSRWSIARSRSFIEARRDERLDVRSEPTCRRHDRGRFSVATPPVGPVAGQVLDERSSIPQPMGGVGSGAAAADVQQPIASGASGEKAGSIGAGGSAHADRRVLDDEPERGGDKAGLRSRRSPAG